MTETDLVAEPVLGSETEGSQRVVNRLVDVEPGAIDYHYLPSTHFRAVIGTGASGSIELVGTRPPVTQQVVARRQWPEVAETAALLEKAWKLVYRYFTTIQGARVTQRHDFETGGEIAVIVLEVTGDPSAVMGEYDTYTRAWIAEVPWPVGNKVVIDFIYA